MEGGGNLTHEMDHVMMKNILVSRWVSPVVSEMDTLNKTNLCINQYHHYANKKL
jgi:hypothetical protein